MFMCKSLDLYGAITLRIRYQARHQVLYPGRGGKVDVYVILLCCLVETKRVLHMRMRFACNCECKVKFLFLLG